MRIRAYVWEYGKSSAAVSRQLHDICRISGTGWPTVPVHTHEPTDLHLWQWYTPTREQENVKDDVYRDLGPTCIKLTYLETTWNNMCTNGLGVAIATCRWKKEGLCWHDVDIIPDETCEAYAWPQDWPQMRIRAYVWEYGKSSAAVSRQLHDICRISGTGWPTVPVHTHEPTDLHLWQWYTPTREQRERERRRIPWLGTNGLCVQMWATWPVPAHAGEKKRGSVDTVAPGGPARTISRVFGIGVNQQWCSHVREHDICRKSGANPPHWVHRLRNSTT